MRKRTLVDIALLLLFSGIGVWLFSLRNRQAEKMHPKPTATPRALDFIKTLDFPTPLPTATPLPRLKIETPTPKTTLLVVRIDAGDAELAVVGITPNFRAPLRNGRAVLQLVDTRPVTLHVEDPWGRSSVSLTANPSSEETVTLDFTPLVFINASPGLRLTPDADHAVVAAVETGSAAEAAGIQAGDIVTDIQDRACGGLSADELREALLGEAGSAIALRVVITNDANEREEHSTTLERR